MREIEGKKVREKHARSERKRGKKKVRERKTC